MGVSLSVFFARDVSFNRLVLSGLKAERALSDRGPAPVLRPHEDSRFYLYIDNAGVVGLEKEVVTERLQKYCNQLDWAGLTTHEVEVTNTCADILGWRLDCQRKQTRITPK